MDTGSGRSVSVWMDDEQPGAREPLDRALEVDVCIVGAGIAGLSTAYELVRQGATVVVLEDGTIGSGETSRTTAHLSNAFDDRYFLVERFHGELGARLLADSHTAAIDQLERIVRNEEIACQFERVDGYLFVPPGESTDLLERELDACRRAGLLDVELVDRAPLAGFDTGRCLRFPRQAQFHPLRYLLGLARAIEARGGRIFTGTHVETIEAGKDGTPARLTLSNGAASVTAQHVVVATNTPVNDMVVLHTKQYPYRTFVIGAAVPDDAVTRALYWDTADPYHYARLVPRDDGDTILIVGGEDHKTGQEDDADERYARLERWARERFPGMGPLAYRWSGQVLEPVDTVAFIGRNPGDENVWVVTGDSGNGLTHGALAGMLLSDLIAGRENPWAKLYEPSRRSLAAALSFTKHNLNVAAQYAGWVTPGDVDAEIEIPKGCGATVRHGLRKHAVYRDDTGQLHRFSAVCPHLGAVVTWNSEEGTWDCPAHGSRFDAVGRVLNGPANSDLAPPSDDQEPRKESTMFVKPEFNSLRDLLLDQLNDLYDAEQRLTEALPKMADAARSSELQRVLRDHLNETQQHVTRLEDVFQKLGVQPESTTCAAMKGLIQEGEHMVQAKGTPAVRDAGIIAAAQRVEHYELAAYGTARTFAQQLGHAEVANILQTTLDEEGAANGRLNAIAMEGVNVEAARS